MHRDCYIGLGSNLGDRHRHLDAALAHLEERWGTVGRCSSRYQTPPWGMSEGTPDFINQVACFSVAAHPLDIMQDLLEVEAVLGRFRDPQATGYQSRTLDLDLLAFDGWHLETDRLTLPHPRIAQRRFVLEPLVELSPELRLKPDGPTVSELLRTCPDVSPLKRLDPIA